MGAMVPTLIVLLLAAAAHAQPKWEIDEKALPPGITRERAQAMLESADAVDAEEGRQQQQRDEARARRLQQAMQKHEERIPRALAADPALAAQRARIEAAMKALDGAGPEDRPGKAQSLAADLKAFRRAAFSKAGIDEAGLQGVIRGALVEGVTRRGEDGAEVEPTITFTDDGGIRIETPEAEHGDPPEVSPRGVLKTVTLVAPFPFSQVEKRIGNSAGSVDKAKGTYRTAASMAYVGSGTNRTGLAHFETIPAGTKNVRVSAQLPETSFYASAMAILGGSQSKPSSRIEVRDGSNGLRCRKSATHADVWVVAGGYFQQDGQDNVALSCTFAAPAAGTDVVVRFTGSVYGQAWGNAGIVSSVRAAPKNVRIEFLN